MFKTLLKLLLVGLASFVMVAFVPLGWGLAGLLWLVLAVRLARRRRRRALWYLVGVLVAFTMFEGGLVLVGLLFGGWDAPNLRQEGGYTEGYMLPDDVLGYAPPPGESVTSKKLAGDTVVYDVVYAIGENGLRSSGPSPPDARGCALFFGGSLTFGEGLPDEQTLPFMVAQELGGEFRVYNFGFHGYGPHQMLAALERGVVERAVVDCGGPVHAFGLYANSHASRSSGRSVWDTHGPRYLLAENGDVVYDGPFDRDVSELGKIARMLLGNSLTYRALVLERKLSQEEIDLLRAIIGKARQTLDARFPGSSFRLIYLDPIENDEDARFDREETARVFSQLGIPVDFLSDIVPDYEDDVDRYTIGPYDRHFNATTNEKMAEHVAGLLRAAPRTRERR